MGMASKRDNPPGPRNLQQELGKKNPFEKPEEEAYLNLVRTADSLSGQVKALMNDFGLSEPLYNVLRIVAARGEAGIPSQSIARDMVCRSPDMTSLVDRLCKAGLVRRVRCEEDRRVIFVQVTPQGQDLLKKIRKPLADLVSDMLSHLTAKQLVTLSQLLFEARHPRNPQE